ncbi:MAG: S8/S53 family peptidase [Acidimicrobiales bacterium]
MAEPVGGGQPRTAVIDTGYAPSVAQSSAYARFSAVDDNSEPDDEIYAGTNAIRPYGGHGTAATARLLSVSGATYVVAQVRDSLVGGGVDEITIVKDLERVTTDGVDIVSIQAGMYTRAGRSPMAFDAFYRRVLRKHPETVLVVAAGNDGSDRPFWPAGYDWCTAVGALTHGGDARAGWTNYGYWVDVYASGENIVVPYPNGTYTYLDGFSADFTQGHAIWSGTSFAAPVVAGMIARRMIERGVSAPEARDVVLAEAAVAALPATGPRVLV